MKTYFSILTIHFFHPVLLVVACVCFTAPALLAANNDTWVGNTDGNWGTAANWQANAVPVANDSLFFGAAGSSGAALTNNLTAGLIFTNLAFNSGGSAFTLVGNSITLAGSLTNNSGSAQRINCNISLLGPLGININDAGGGLTIGGSIGGNGSLTNSGSGVLTLTNTGNTFNGGMTINGTVLAMGNGGSSSRVLGNAGKTVTVNPGGTLIVSNGPMAFGGNVLVINGGVVSNSATAGCTLPSFTMTNGGVLVSNPGNPNTTQYQLYGNGTICTITSLASTKTSVMSGNCGAQSTPVIFDVAAGSVTGGATPGVDLLVAANIGNVGGATHNIVKTSAGVLALSGTNIYSGSTTISNGVLYINAGVGGSLNGSSPYSALTFGGAGTFNFDNTTATGAKSQNMGALTFSAGEGTLKTTKTAAQNVTLTFSSLAARTAGASGNFISGGVSDAANKIVLTGATTGALLDKGFFFSGSSYAAYNSSSGYVRAYTTSDANAVSSPGAATLGVNDSTKNAFVTGSITAQTTASVNTINLAANNLTFQSTASTLNVNGILSSGAATAQIANGTSASAIQPTAAGGEMVVRVDGFSDKLRIDPTIQDNTSASSLTKAGAGTLTLSATETYTGATTVNAGTLTVNGSLNASSAVTVQNGATFGGTGTAAGTLNVAANGIIQPTSSGTPGTLTLSSSTAPSFTAPCTLKIRVPSSSTADQVNLSSTTPAFACANLDLVIDASGLTGSTFTTPAIVNVAKTSSGITGTFHSVTVVNNPWGYVPTVNYNTQTITVTMTASPTLTTSGTLAAVNTTYGTASATPTSFAVSGNALTGNLTVTPPSGYEISTSIGSGYATSLTLTPTSGTLASTTIYARLAATTGVGSYSGNTQISGGGATTANVATVSSTVSAKPITVGSSSGQSKVYGASDPTLTYTNTPLVGGDSFSGALSRAAGENVGSGYAISQNTLTAGANYSITFNSANFAITTRPITLTAQTNIKIYDGSTTATNVPILTSGTLASGDGFATLAEHYSDATVGTGKTLIPTVAITNSATTDDTANYTITPVNDTTGVINLAQATTSLLLTNNIGITNYYGQTLIFTAVVQTNSVTAANASSNVVFSLGSAPVWTNAVTGGTSYYTNTDLTVSVTNFTAQYLGDNNYLGSSVTVTQTVLPATPTLTLTPGGISYGQTLVSSSLTSSAATNANNAANVSGSFAFSDNTIAPNAGTTNVAVIFTPTDMVNYVSVTNTVNVAVSPLPASVTADAKTKIYGAMNPTLTATVVGTINGDVLNYTLATDAAQFSSAGISNITVTLGGNPNYSVLATNGTLTIYRANTFVGASSTENPSGYKDAISFIATLPADAAGSVVFSSTNGLISTNSVSSGIATSLSITNLPRGTNVITVTYLGDGNYLGSTTNLDQIVTNHPPVANVMTVTRTAGLALIIKLSDIATNWSDVDGDLVELTSVTMQSTNGVNLFPLNWSTNLDGSIVTTNGYAYIGYTNSPNVNDQISYGISDGQGGTNIGYVNILIQGSVTGTNSITGHDFSSPYSNTVTAQGIPYFYYILERSTNLSSPVWVDVQTNQANLTNGVINAADTFLDLGGVKPPSAFYQLKWQP